MQEDNAFDGSSDDSPQVACGFDYTKYFVSKEAFLTFVLLHVDNEKRAELLGIKEEMYDSPAEAKRWRNSLVKLLHSDRCKHLSADEATSKVNEIYARMKRYAARKG